MLSTAVTECPAKAIQLLHYRDVQVEAEIAALMAPEVVEVCSWGDGAVAR